MIRKVELREITESLSISGKTVATRPIGEMIFQKALQQLNPIKSGDAIELSFAGLYVSDTSFLDEYVLGFQRLLLEKYPGAMIFVTHIDDCVFENLKRLILSWEAEGIRIPVLCLRNDQYEIIGKLEANLLEAFDICMQKKQLTARELAEEKGLVLSTASTRMRKLYEFRVIYRREVIDSYGKQYVYMFPE